MPSFKHLVLHCRWEALDRSLQRVDVVHDNRGGEGAGLPLDKVSQLLWAKARQQTCRFTVLSF